MVVPVVLVNGAGILSARLVVALGLVGLALPVLVGTEIGMLSLLEHGSVLNHCSRVDDLLCHLLVAHVSS